MNARLLTAAERRQRGTQLCGRLALEVASIVPAGIGGWARAWEITAAPDADFMAALSAWEADPTPTTLARTRVAYKAVLESWRDAACQFQARSSSDQSSHRGT